MFFFRRELETLAAEIRDGRSASVIALPGAGASTLLKELVRTLEAEGYSALTLAGHSYARGIDGFPLQEAGLSSRDGRGGRGVGGWIDLVSDELRSPRASFAVLDGIDAMDSTTLSVVQAALQRTAKPAVVARSRSLLTMRASGVEYSLPLGVGVALPPLDYPSTAKLVQHRLGHFPQAEIVSRIFAASGGIVGLALAYTDGARTGGLIRLDEGRWSMRTPRLWSSTVEGWIESLLARLCPEEVDALRHLAITHGESAEPCTHVTVAVVRELELRGLLRTTPGEHGMSYAVSPPALATFFAAAHTRRQDGGKSGAFVLVNRARNELAYAVGAHRDRAQQEIIERQASWDQEPSVAHAIPYVLSLFRSTPKANRTIDAVLTGTSLTTAKNPTEAFDLEFIRSVWRAGGLRDGRTPFHEFVELFPEWAETTRLFFEILDEYSPLRPSQLDEDDPDFIGSMPGGDLLIAAHAYSALLAGRFDEAHRWAHRIPPSGTLTVRRLGGFVVALAKFSVGDIVGAIVDTRTRITEAIADADHSALLTHTYVQMLSMLGVGQWDQALDAVNDALAFGPPSPMDAGFYKALLHGGAFLNLARGERRTCEIFLAEAESVYVPPTPLPGMQTAMSEGIRHLLDGHPADAGTALRHLAGELGQSGATFAALLTLRIALFFWPEQATLQAYACACESTSDGLPEAFIEIVSTAFEAPSDLPPVAARLRGKRHVDMAALVLTARMNQLPPTEATSIDAIRDAIALLDAPIPAQTATSAPFSGAPAPGASTVLLSKREREIALLSRNHTNAEIATRLNLSVRTVESHLHNAFRKAQVSSRADLFEIARG